ncbi:MAG: N-acetylmuramic acid 6-phosphate etherase [Planctomycetota bacterium]
MNRADGAAPLRSTEAAPPGGGAWSSQDPLTALAAFHQADLEAAEAVRRAHGELARAVDAIAERLARGGRLIYVGAGTSGRLGVLDAAECQPTFQTAPQTVQALMAGGEKALVQAIEGAEDDREAGAAGLSARRPTPSDCVLGISASGGAPFVHGALEAGRAAGALTVFLACVPFHQAPDPWDLSIRLDTGPELLAGSTRLKAGSATKMALNALSTLVMARLGKVHGYRMVDVNTGGNRKLWQRGVRMVAELCALTSQDAEALLQAAEGQVKVACVMHSRGVPAEKARECLAQNESRLDRCLLPPAGAE